MRDARCAIARDAWTTHTASTTTVVRAMNEERNAKDYFFPFHRRWSEA